MKEKSSRIVFNFRYSIPLEESFSELASTKILHNHHEKMEKISEIIQRLWDPYENKILTLFEEMYRIKINLENQIIWITEILPNSVSMPLIVSIKNCWNDDISPDIERSIVLNVIHEIAHLLSFTYRESYINSIYYMLQRLDLDTHYFIQAVEFGIGTELFGEEFINSHIKFIVSDKNFPYRESILKLLDQKISLNRECLNSIARLYKDDSS